MRRGGAPDVEADALRRVAELATAWLERLRGARGPGEQDALAAEFAVGVDELRADLRRDHGLTERDAATVVARALSRLVELSRAAGG